ncbi:conserved hypothetical protein [Rhodopseudomonas palustris HaA2]|uniref:Mll5186 protein n=1 Tax=Rhodopseudomonas palustris (strain HaA2) TaxID=316058 RepID=Q2IU24_RHOP2|nr:hypothetical protein [Rhodopseudomonas palustris]ABD08286.1 conserved hypothetical protein [Rhodopseudomonas palustris HaA2]
MEQTLATGARGDLSGKSGVSWAAVVAGAVVSCALTLVLLAFGAGVGFSVVSPWGSEGVSATTFKIGTGLYFIVIAMISSAVGGYLAGRLRAKWVGIDSNEITFRDTAHGLLVWALATVVGAALLAAPASALIGGVGAATSTVASAARSSGAMDGYVDQLLRAGPAPQAQGNPSESRGELTRLLTSSVENGDGLSAGDRSYVANLVAARTGLSQADAEQRVDQVVTGLKSSLEDARQAGQQLSIWLTLSLFIGALSACLAAMEGGGLRDGTWGKQPVFRRNSTAT